MRVSCGAEGPPPAKQFASGILFALVYDSGGDKLDFYRTVSWLAEADSENMFSLDKLSQDRKKLVIECSSFTP